MCTRSLSRFSIAAVFGVIVVAGMFVRVSAQTKGTPEKYNATAINMGSGPGMAGRVLIAVDRWSTEKEREALLKVFVEKGPDKLLDALHDNPKTGYIRLPQTLAWDLRYAYETPLPEGGRRVVLITDRRISMAEAVNNPRVSDYPFTLIEIRFDKARRRRGEDVGGDQDLAQQGQEDDRARELRDRAGAADRSAYREVAPMIRACAILVALVAIPSIGAGQTPASGSPDAGPPVAAQSSIEATVQALVRTIESQQKQLEEQGRQIEQLRREIAETRGLRPASPADGAAAAAPSPAQQAAAAAPPAAVAATARTNSLHAA